MVEYGHKAERPDYYTRDRIEKEAKGESNHSLGSVWGFDHLIALANVECCCMS